MDNIEIIWLLFHVKVEIKKKNKVMNFTTEIVINLNKSE